MLTKSYEQDENALTKALLHVIEAGCNHFLQTLLKVLDVCDDFRMYEVHTQNRISSAVGNTHIVCDGLIQTHPFRLIIESKIKPNSIRKEQLDNQLKICNESATYFEDWKFRNQLLKTAEIIGHSVKSNGSRHYLLANFAVVVEAIALAMRTTTNIH